MQFSALHSWDIAASEAACLQRELAGRVDARTPLPGWRLVAGADVSHDRFSPIAHAGVVVMDREGTIVERQGAVLRMRFPYLPGFLSFREAPPLLEAFARLRTEPDLIMLDGHGLAHPRRLGLACHVGLWLDRPCLACAKSRLIGSFREPGWRAGSATQLRDGKEVIGRVVRTRDGVRPVFVSVGHRIDLPSAVRVVLACCRGCRLPEPARAAHHYVNQLRRGEVRLE